jgi:hypothetical protein
MITLNAQPTACAIVRKSASVVDAARSTGAAIIDYAPADRENLATTHPGAIVASLADLVLILRSRPLPIKPFSHVKAALAATGLCLFEARPVRPRPQLQIIQRLASEPVSWTSTRQFYCAIPYTT